jgi:hypothetical protein
MDLTNFQTAIRVDAQTQQGSILDVIRLINPNLSSGNAANTLKVMTTWMTINHSHILINGKGKLTPVADARTLVEIIWALPGKAARDFRRASADTVCRVLGGDVSLLAEIEARNGSLQQTEEGRSVQSFLVHHSGEQAAVEHTKHAPTELELATADQRQTYVNCWLARQHGEVVQQIMTTLKSAVDLMQALGGVDDRDKIEFKDRIRLAMRPTYTQGLIEGTAAAVVDPGPGVATHDCSESVRGSEISIPMLATEMHVNIGDRAGQIGKRMKKLYAQTYGEAAARAIPKRETIFRGKPLHENTYYKRDKALLQQAIEEVMAGK